MSALSSSLRAACVLLLFVLACMPPGAGRRSRCVLDDRRGSVDSLARRDGAVRHRAASWASRSGPWPRRQRFAPPAVGLCHAGRARGRPVWLRIPVVVPAGQRRHWILDIDYAVLNRVDLTWRSGGQRGASTRWLGNLHEPGGMRRVPHAGRRARPGAGRQLTSCCCASRTAAPRSCRSAFHSRRAFHAAALGEQMLQGMLLGLRLCLLLYSLAPMDQPARAAVRQIRAAGRRHHAVFGWNSSASARSTCGATMPG